jgi:hypothetical protein
MEREHCISLYLTSRNYQPMYYVCRCLRPGQAIKLGSGVLALLLSWLLQTEPASAEFVHALSALNALVSSAPAVERGLFSTVLTSGQSMMKRTTIYNHYVLVMMLD